MSTTTDFIVLQFIQQGQQALQGTFQRLGDGADEMQGRFEKIAGFLDGPTSSMRNFSRETREAFRGAQTADTALANMMEKHGESGRLQEIKDFADALGFKAGIDDDEIKNAATGLEGFGVNAERVKGLMPGLIGQARTYHQSLEGVTEAVGRAFSSGDLGAVRRVGITFTDADIEDFKKRTEGKSEEEKQAILYEMLAASMKKYAVDVEESLGAAELAVQRFGKVWGDTQENIGEGAEKTRTMLYNFTTPLLQNLNQAHPGLLQTIGEISEIGGMAGQILGPLNNVWGTMRDIKQTKDLAKIAGGAAGALGGGGMTGTMNVSANIVNVSGGGGLPGLPGGADDAAALADDAAGAATKATTAGKAFLSASAFGVEGLAALGIAAGALAVTAYAGVKGVEWWNDAKTMSDEEMHKQGPVEGFIADAGKSLANNPLSRAWRGDNSADAASKEAQRIDAEHRAKYKALGIRPQDVDGGVRTVENPPPPGVTARAARSRNGRASVNVAVDVPFGPGDYDADDRAATSLYGA